MNLLHKSILILITISVFIFLIFVTFITNNLSKIENPSYEIKEKGIYKLVEKEDGFFISKDLINSSGSIFINKINISDKIIYSYGNIESKSNGSIIEINITPGIYYFQLKEINTKYSINSNGFNVINKGPGSFIINNLNPRKIIVFSIDTLLDLNLKDIKTDKKISSISLYPHVYLVFNPIKNIFVKNSDLLKISQIFNLGFFKDTITNSETFLNLILLKNKKGTELINNSFSFLNNEQIEREKIIKKYRQSIFGTLPGEKFIEMYNSIFINPNKKILYYKNIILRKTNDLLSIQTNDINTINQIVEKLEQLKGIDSDAYNEVVNIINFHYSNVIISNQNSNIKINFTKLINKINSNNSSISLKSLIYLEEIFGKYNSELFFQNINTFTNQYFSELKISINGNEKNKGTISELENVDYLLYFIENIMMNTSLENIKSTTHIINIFDNYMNIANSFYSYSNEDIKRIGLYINLDILNKFDNIIKSYYFNSREKGQILTMKNGTIINNDDILKLEKNITKIFLLFSNNQNILNSTKSNKDKFLSTKLYPNLKLKYDEYFYALNDYDKYLSIYDKGINDILTAKTLSENNKEGKINLSIKKAKEYLSVFNGINFNNSTIYIKDYSYCNNPTEETINNPLITPFCYKIDNLKINNKNLSFLLYPFLNNKIDDIYLGGVSKLSSYKLDEIKIEMDEKVKNVKKDKELFEFSNFLLNTFGDRTLVNNTNEEIKEEIKEQDNSFIRIFKRNKLLGELGDFNDLNGVVDILYDDLNIKKIGDTYDINIEGSKFKISLSKTLVFQGLLSSKYDFSEKHSFINPKIKLIREKKDLLLGNYIYIKGDYVVNNIEDGLKTILGGFKEIDFIVKTIYSKLNNYNIAITYNKNTNSISYSTTYNSKKIIIKYLNGKIISVISNGKSIISTPINYKLLDSILNKITNPEGKEKITE